MLTMSKESLLKKILVKNAIVAATVLAAVFGCTLYLSNYNDTVMAEQAAKQGRNNAASAEQREIEATLGIQNEVAKYYDAYAGDHNTNFTINREAITAVLTSLRRIHHFANALDVTVSPVTDMPESGMGVKSGKMVKSTVRIVFGALTDSSVYDFIYDLQHKLPGAVLVSELKINKIDELSRNIVTQAVSRHILIPLVKGELSFVWLGVRSAQENAAIPANGSGNAR